LRLRKYRAATIPLASAFFLFVGLSAAFDVAYGRAVRKKDVRSALRYDLQKTVGDSSATIGVSDFGPYFYTVMPGVEPQKVQLQDPRKKADFFVVGYTGRVDPAWSNASMRAVEAQ
jgi:hypothetical protein